MLNVCLESGVLWGTCTFMCDIHVHVVTCKHVHVTTIKKVVTTGNFGGGFNLPIEESTAKLQERDVAINAMANEMLTARGARSCRGMATDITFYITHIHYVARYMRARSHVHVLLCCAVLRATYQRMIV